MSEPQPKEQDNQREAEAVRQRQVEDLAEDYLERLIAGETPDRLALLAAHPDLADLLGPRLELVEMMHRVARAQRPAVGETASPAPAERALRMKCPHCGNGIQLVEPTDREVTCGSCGSSFHVDARATTTFNRAALPRSVGKFEVLEQLGRGAFGTVYKARDPELQRLVAVKVPRTGSFATVEEEERFLREARSAAQLSHPGIVPVLEIAHDHGLPYIVSEYVEGLTLADVLTARRPNFRDSAELTAAVADALDYAHRQKIVHRDIKPSNLLLDAAGRPHITDFGLARRGEGEITVTLDGQILGTPAYMSPEQAAGDQHHVDARSDVYSLGVVLYELLTGELPFRGNQRMLLHQVIHDEPRPPRSLNDRVPRDLETICLKAMAKTPARRYASAQEMADDLRRFLNGESIRARRVGRTEKLSRWARRNPVVAALTSTVAFLLTAVSLVAVSFALYQRQAKNELAAEKDKAEQSQREAEVRAASAAVDLDLKHCQDGELEYGVLRLARTLAELPPHATELRECVEMNLLAWAQEIRPLGPTFQYDGAETTWELSPDGLTVLTAGADGTARLWDAFTGEVRATLRGHRGKIASVAFSQNGRVAMTVGEDRTVRLWDASNGQARGVTTEHTKSIDKALLSPDARRLLTISHIGKITFPWLDNAKTEALKNRAMATLWDSSTGKRISDLTGHEGQLYDAVFSPNGHMVLTGGADKTARLWSAESGRPLATLEGNTGLVGGVAFSPDGSLVATLQCKGLVRWWDPQTFMQLKPPCISPYIISSYPPGFRFIQREVVTLDGSNGMGSTPGQCFIRGLEKSIEFPATALTTCKADDDCVIDTRGRVYDRKSGNRRPAPAKRKFSEELARFATAHHFYFLDQQLVDLRTEKSVGRGFTVQYVPDRQSFLIPNWPSLKTIPMPTRPIDTEIARLFAEVVTCHKLDPLGTTKLLKETEWEERRRKLAKRLDEHSTPSLISRVVADRWYWLRRQIDRATSADEKIKYLDRLITVEPTWQNYQQRTEVHWLNSEWIKCAWDELEAGRLAGTGYWYRAGIENLSIWGDLIWNTGTSSEHQMGLRLVEALRRARPDDREFRVLNAMALYRVGRYSEAFSLLEDWQREWQRNIASQVGQFFMSPCPVGLLVRAGYGPNTVRAMSVLAMTLYRLGHSDRARSVLASLETLLDGSALEPEDVSSLYRFGKEAKSLIEGKPQSGK